MNLWSHIFLILSDQCLYVIFSPVSNTCPFPSPEEFTRKLKIICADLTSILCPCLLSPGKGGGGLNLGNFFASRKGYSRKGFDRLSTEGSDQEKDEDASESEEEYSAPPPAPAPSSWETGFSFRLTRFTKDARFLSPWARWAFCVFNCKLYPSVWDRTPFIYFLWD